MAFSPQIGRYSYPNTMPPGKYSNFFHDKPSPSHNPLKNLYHFIMAKLESTSATVGVVALCGLQAGPATQDVSSPTESTTPRQEAVSSKVTRSGLQPLQQDHFEEAFHTA
tara:strand:- start:4776 stop:5105 length:330 start_codon:yes stop_codon:yes gene_type:complete